MVRRLSVVVAAALAFSACDVNSALEQVVEARAVTAELMVQFTKAVEASNRAVMANTEAGARAAGADASAAVALVDSDVTRLGSLLGQLRFTDETTILETFAKRFAEYKSVHQRMVDLAVEGTNLQAEQLAFGPALAAADALASAVTGLPAPAAERWHTEALAGRVLVAVREIQALYAPHIQEAGDEVMTRLEARMSAAAQAARTAMADVAIVVSSDGRPRVAEATRHLEEFLRLNTRIVELSRRNTNVRSLALALDERRRAAEACETVLRNLQQALAQRGFVGTR